MDKTGTNPKYMVVKKRLEHLVKTLAPGDRLPSERQMAESLGCNFLTVRKAMAMLVETGMIVRRSGSGTYVAESHEALGGGQRIGVLISAQSDSYALRVLEALEAQARAEGVSLLSRMVGEFSHETQHLARQLKREGCAALIIPWFAQNKTSQVAEFARSCPLPVSLPALIPGLEDNFFELPDLFGVNLVDSISGLCEYLRRIGFSKIAFVGPDTTSNALLQKNLAGYSGYVSRRGMDNLCSLVPAGAPGMDELAGRLRGFGGELGVVCYDDDHALRFITSMHKLGLNAPDDFGIVGIGNIDWAEIADPPLTSIYDDFAYPAHWMLRNALALGRGEVERSAQKSDMAIMIRQSCGGLHRCGGKAYEIAAGCGFVVPDGLREFSAPAV